jgi:two-component sensor histidine kinase
MVGPSEAANLPEQARNATADRVQDLQPPRRATRAFTVAAAVSFLLLLAAAALLYRVSMEARNAERWIVHTFQVKQTIASLLADLNSAEAAQRGYLLTGDPVFLEPYGTLRVSLDRKLRELRDAVDDNAGQAARLDAMRPAVGSRLAVIESTLIHVHEGQLEEAKRAVREVGLPLMKEIRARLVEMDEAESSLLVSRQAEVGKAQRNFLLSILALVLACAALTILSFVSVRRYLAAINESRASLAHYNAVLEARVNARTEELAKAAEIANRERARAEALLTDVNHRVGNNLALVSSFLTMQQRAVSNPDAARALNGAKARVQAIASAHRKLRLGADFATVNAGEVLGAVLEDIATGLPPDALIKIVHEVEPMEINARDAVSLGVLTSELVMNAIKHAFAPGERGQVEVVLSNEAGAGPALVVSDDGVGLHEKQAHEPGGLGSKIIDMVAKQFGGRPERTPWREDQARPGTRVRVGLPKLRFVQPA